MNCVTRADCSTLAYHTVFPSVWSDKKSWDRIQSEIKQTITALREWQQTWSPLPAEKTKIHLYAIVNVGPIVVYSFTNDPGDGTEEELPAAAQAGAHWLKSSFAEKDLRVLVDNLQMSQWCHLAASWSTTPWAAASPSLCEIPSVLPGPSFSLAEIQCRTLAKAAEDLTYKETWWLC